MADVRPYRTELSPVSFLRRSAYVFPDKIAVVHGARRYTYRQLEERVNRLASALPRGRHREARPRGLPVPEHPGDARGALRRARPRAACWCRSTRGSARDEIGYILEHSGARFLFVDRELEPLVEAARPAGLTVVRVDDTGAPGDPYEDFLAGGSPERRRELVLEDEEETISINYTSGTTGPPEGRHVHAPRRLPERARRGASRPG